MKTNNKVVIAGLSVNSVLGQGLTEFSRVLYQETRHIQDRPYVCNASDVSNVACEALKDAGIVSDVKLSLWICGEVSGSDLANHLTNSNYSVRTKEHQNSLASGLKQAISSLYERQSSAALVIAKDDFGVGALVLVSECNIVSGDGYGIFEILIDQDSAHSHTICQDALSKAGIESSEIGYLEYTMPSLSDGVIDAYRDAGYDLTCALGNLTRDYPFSYQGDIKPNIGICSLIKTICALYSRTLPAYPSWALIGERKRWHHTPFYSVQDARPWFIEPGKLKRFAAWLNVEDDNITHIIFSEPRNERSVSQVKSVLGERTVYLLPIPGQDQSNLKQNLLKLKNRLDNGESLQVISHDLITQFDNHQQAPFAFAIVGRNRDEVIREIELAQAGVDKTFTSGQPYKTPRGSTFTSNPQRDGDVAFVYPGAFNSYVGFGRELLLHFPFLHERLSVLISNVGRSLAERRLYPRSLERLTGEEKETWALRLTQNPIAMIESGTTFAIAYSIIMREVFDVQPQSAMGYSLGEISMLWSAGVWNAGDAGSDAWHASPLFKTRLFGPKQAVREAWKIHPKDDTFWSTYLLKASEDKVRTLADQEPYVFLTIVNLPGEVVIAGNDEACQRIIKSLGCHAIKTPFDSVIHNEIVRSEYDTFVDLYTHPIHHIPDIVFYSAAEYAPLAIEANSLAHAIADMTCKPVHLPRLVQTVYDSGARIFIELGPQATCSRWIDRILRDVPHVAVPINRTGMGDYHGIITVLAQLITHRVKVDLQPLLSVNQQDLSRKIVIQDVMPEYVSQKAASLDYQEHHDQVPFAAQISHAQRDADTEIYHPDAISNAFQVYVFPHQKRIAQNHMAFLQTRHSGLQDAGSMIEMQIAVAQEMLGNHIPEAAFVTQNASTLSSENHKPSQRFQIGSLTEQAIFDKYHLVEFASGSAERCFGKDYSVYKGRRLPRIPNGDLLLMDRIMTIDGRRGDFSNEPALVSEYDVPYDAWYFNGSSTAPMFPYAVMMEVALQPCGFLSAYLGSTLSTPRIDYYFRNLDGYGRLLCDFPMRGKTIRNTVKLISSISLQGIIMQRYKFHLQCEGQSIYEGGATFGYFTADALKDQVGLDKGEKTAPYFAGHQQEMRHISVPSRDQLHGLDRCSFSPTGGRYSKGYIYGESIIDPNAWFFKCHFYQDPVMPGSLGVDLMYQALELSMNNLLKSRNHLSDNGSAIRLSYDVNRDVTWMYRGQVNPSNHKISIEMHIKESVYDVDGITTIAEASLWVDGLRIYGIHDLTLRMIFM